MPVQGPPTPWWQLPENTAPSANGQSGLQNLQSSAPAGYTYDPVQMAYVHSPTQAGQAANQFTTAAMGGGGGTNPLSSLSSSMGGLQAAAGIGGSGGGATAMTGGGVTANGAGINPGSAVPGIKPIDNTAANNAAFGAAKDTAGRTARASLDSLRGILGETGQLGSGAEVQGSKNVVENAAGLVGDVNRQNAVTNSNQALEIAKANQSSGLTQRGQDIAAMEAKARLAQEQAALQSNQQLQMLQMALGMIPKGGSSSYTY